MAACLLVLGWGIGQIKQPIFDEFHYIPAAKAMLQGQYHLNNEHPPLAKWFVSWGLYLCGDNPLGWRIMSLFSGTLTIIGMYFLAWVVFGQIGVALWVALISLFNQMVFVQARIAMLDTFMVTAVIWGLVFFYGSQKDSARQNWQKKLFFNSAAAAFFAWAAACKWFGLIPLFFFAAFSLVSIFRFRALTFASTNLSFILRQWGLWLFCWVFIPLFAYFLAYIPELNTKGSVTVAAIFEHFWNAQVYVLDAQKRVPAQHPYTAHWLTWPLMIRPIYYAYTQDGNFFRSVILLGNPVVIWVGLASFFFAGIKQVYPQFLRAPKASAKLGSFEDSFDHFRLLTLLTYIVFYFSWAIIPRKSYFFYYYYPAAMMLSLILAFAFFRNKEQMELEMAKALWRRSSFWFLIATMGTFIYFYPVISGMALSPFTFQRWVWFETWR